MVVRKFDTPDVGCTSGDTGKVLVGINVGGVVGKKLLGTAALGEGVILPPPP